MTGWHNRRDILARALSGRDGRASRVAAVGLVVLRAGLLTAIAALVVVALLSQGHQGF